MLKRCLLSFAASSLVVLFVPALAVAASGTMRASFVKDRPAVVDVAMDGIRVADYHFDRLTRGDDKLFKVGGGPSIVFDVKNEGTEKKDFAIAVALFDGEGHLVGAATGSHSGKLDPGETKEVKVVFHGVSRDVHRAATMFMTLETER